MTAAGTIRATAEIDHDLAVRVFGSRDAIALGGWPGATTGRSWASSARFAEDAANGAIADDVEVAMYDPEHWDATPLDERLDRTRVDPELRRARAIDRLHRADHPPSEPRLGPGEPARTDGRRDARVRLPPLRDRGGGGRERRRDRDAGADAPTRAGPLSRVRRGDRSRRASGRAGRPGAVGSVDPPRDTRRRSRCCETPGRPCATSSTGTTCRSRGCAGRGWPRGSSRGPSRRRPERRRRGRARPRAPASASSCSSARSRT